MPRGKRRLIGLKPNLRLKMAIMSSGKRQWEVAKAAGMTPVHFSMIATGRMNPDLDEQRRIASALRKPVGVLFGREEVGDNGG